MTLFTWTNFAWFILEGCAVAALILAIPTWIFQDNHVLLDSGHTVDLMTLSITSATCLFTCVTVKLCVYTRWWTKYHFIVLSMFSIGFYVIFLWISNHAPIDGQEDVVALLHNSPLFWLTVFLTGSICYIVDLLIEYYRFNINRNGSDYVRKLVDDKIGESMNPERNVGITPEDLNELNIFMKPIKRKYME